jgi:hypothetical protein
MSKKDFSLKQLARLPGPLHQILSFLRISFFEHPTGGNHICDFQAPKIMQIEEKEMEKGT